MKQMMAFNETDRLSVTGSTENILRFDDAEPVLETRGLSVAYGENTAISDVEF